MTVKYFGVEIEKCEQVYPPSDDTFLLIKACRPFIESRDRFLEIGVGTGLLSIVAVQHGAEVVATDINPNALKCARKNAELNEVTLTLKKSDLFQNIQHTFDMIVFNPPYLPAIKEDVHLSSSMRKALVGGNTGNEIALKFINTVGNYLTSNGLAFLTASSRGGKQEIINNLKDKGYSVAVVKKSRFFFEELAVLKIKKKH